MVLPNPVMTASGCAANGQELHRFFPVSELGAFVTKTVMAQPRSGRGTPRMAETASGMLNSIGLQGPGIDAFVEKDLAWLKSTGARALVSIAGNTAEEFGDVAERAGGQPGLRRRRGRRGQHLVPQRRQPRSGLRLRRAVVGAGGAARA